jgi:hypothetical protein
VGGLGTRHPALISLTLDGHFRSRPFKNYFRQTRDVQPYSTGFADADGKLAAQGLTHDAAL